MRLTNRFGTQPVTFASAWVGLQGQGAGLVRGSNRKLSFACKETVTVAAGQEVLSDPLSLEFLPFQHLAVSLHVTGSSGAATQHRLGRQISYAAGVAAGNLAADESASGFDTTHNVTYFVNSVEAVAPDSTGAVVTFGDSITDGFVSTGGLATNADPAIDGADSSYPDRLARRIAAEGFGARFSVVNAGISGNRLLSDAMPGFPQFGPSGLSRLSADVIARAGVSDVILLIGTNDLGMAPPATADQVIAGLQQAVARLKAAKLNVLLATQTPSFGPVVPGGHGSPTAVAFRNQINAWVRSQTVADGVVDFHAALRDPANADALNPIYDSGDRLHPNSASHEAMARAINLSLLRGPR